MEKWFYDLPTPCYVVEESRIIKNLEILRHVMDETGCRILLAQKAFSMYSMYPLIRKYLCGTSSSGLCEARLGAEFFGGENHIYSPAYKEEEFGEITSLCGHILFNSFPQWERFGKRALLAGCSCGLRVNPECSTQGHAIYDPCAPGSRLGITLENFHPEMLEGISGLHMHTLCEQNADALVMTLKAVEEKFGKYIYGMQWLNLGGGHHITRDDYDVETLIAELNRLKEKYEVQLYLEPGEAIALNAGFLVCSILDIMHNGLDIAILDTSAACHMPDVLEMPYCPEIIGAGKPQSKPYTYRLAGATCLAGDIIGDYSFDGPLKPGDRLVFCDMAHYTMVKNNTFNGMPLPSIVIHTADGKNKLVRTFGYDDFKWRLS